MNEQEQLKLQAYLDGELTRRERHEVETWLEARADAQALLAGLRRTRAAMQEGEPDHRLNCSRDFYWQNISRAIAATRQEPASGRSGLLVRWMRHHLVQLAGAGAGVALLIFAFILTNGRVPADSEWEVRHPSTGMVTYRDFQSRMTVVMIYDRSSPVFTEGD